MDMSQIFKIKRIVNFRQYGSRKKFRFGGVKMAKWKNWRTDSSISGSRMSLECVVSVAQRRRLSLPPFLHVIFYVKVAIMITARAPSSSESIYNIKENCILNV